MPRVTVSSHGFGVAEAIALARAFGTLAQHCIVYAIEAADFTPGARPTAAVMTAANVVATRIAGRHASVIASQRRSNLEREGEYQTARLPRPVAPDKKPGALLASLSPSWPVLPRPSVVALCRYGWHRWFRCSGSGWFSAAVIA